MLKTIRKVLKPLAYFWDCKQLDTARQGKFVSQSMAFYTAPTPRTVKREVLPKMCAMRRKMGDAALRAVEKHAEQALSENVTIDEARDLGVVDEDSMACYMANTHKTTSHGRKQFRLSVCALTIVRGKVLTYCLDRPKTDDALETMLADSKKDIAALHEANSD